MLLLMMLKCRLSFGFSCNRFTTRVQASQHGIIFWFGCGLGQQSQTSQHVRLTGQRWSTGVSGSVNGSQQQSTDLVSGPSQHSQTKSVSVWSTVVNRSKRSTRVRPGQLSESTQSTTWSTMVKLSQTKTR
ncbi:hypothetical protein Hdeb2414_s0012g00392011 [Helianthus debilis subsp. tardiflorus]